MPSMPSPSNGISANSYDNDTGVCDMELSIFYEEYDTNFILYMTLPNGEINVYKGFVSGP